MRTSIGALLETTPGFDEQLKKQLENYQVKALAEVHQKTEKIRKDKVKLWDGYIDRKNKTKEKDETQKEIRDKYPGAYGD